MAKKKVSKKKVAKKKVVKKATETAVKQNNTPEKAQTFLQKVAAYKEQQAAEFNKRFKR